jgi:hypothetical protein
VLLGRVNLGQTRGIEPTARGVNSREPHPGTAFRTGYAGSTPVARSRWNYWRRQRPVPTISAALRTELRKRADLSDDRRHR